MQQELKPLPISKSDITTLLTHDFLYIDKTKLIYEMVKLPASFFLSRPRRFGKSTLLSTLNEIFLGKKELFKNQWIYNSNWDWQIYPIIRLDFNVAKDDDLKQYIKNRLKNIAKTYKIFVQEEYNNCSYTDYFRTLIEKLHDTYEQQVIILIDEYDKPILDVIDNIEEAKAKREILKGFYGTIKGVDEHIRFIFLTGVTRFSKVGVFSGLNNLNDITLDNKFATVCGITQEELELHCKDYIELLANKEQLTYTECLLKIKHWYNGFCFSEDGSTVYSPYSTFLLLDKQKFANYWFSSGNPSFLIKLLMKNKYYLPNLRATSVDPVFFDSFDIDKIDLTVLLLQAGYLTISKTPTTAFLQDQNNQRELSLAPPNYEIFMSLNAYILQYIYGDAQFPSKINQQFVNCIISDDIINLKTMITSLFASISHHWYTNNNIQEYEGFYCSVFYAFLVGSGYSVIAEDTTSHGRIDLTLILQNCVYIFELKTTNKDKPPIDTNHNSALEQIISKGYADKYHGKYNKIYLIGAEFSESERNVSDFSYKIINN